MRPSPSSTKSRRRSNRTSGWPTWSSSPGLIRGSDIKPGATVIDVGTTVVDGQLKGDVDYESVLAVAGAITPVPGGVGPVTNIALLRNVVKAASHASS